MKRAGLPVIVAAALLLVAGSAGAQSLGQLSKVVDLGATLQSLSETASHHKPLSTGGRLVLLSGVAASISSLSNDPKRFLALIELVRGKWKGLQSVSLYRCYVLVRGPRFASQVLLHPTAHPAADAVKANSQLLVVGELRGTISAPDGSEVPVVEAYYLRPLD